MTPLAKSIALAVTVWHLSAAPTVNFTDLPRATAGEAAAGVNVITLNEQSPYAKRWPNRLLCHAILHEAGHIAGMGHSDNPASVMFHLMTPDKANHRWIGVDPRCIRLFP